MLAGLILTGIASLRGGEYDEFYTIFLISGHPRPVWPTSPFLAGSVRGEFRGSASFGAIARNLRALDVHPPLYFWLAKLWRGAVGSSVFRIRMLSVICGVIALALLARIAAAIGVDPPLTVAITAMMYGFAYSSIVARDFALTSALVLGGVLLLIRAAREGLRFAALLGGGLLAAACCTNDLAVFSAVAVMVWILSVRWRLVGWVLLGAVGFVPGWIWFYLGQRDARAGQFRAFQLIQAVYEVLRDQAASVLGGLPRYVPAALEVPVGLVLVAVLALVVGLSFGAELKAQDRRLLLLGAVAPAVGLLVLGTLFDTMPFELRYFWLSLPFIGILLAAALMRRPWLAALFFAIEAVSMVGLAAAPQTMQPSARLARLSALAAGSRGLVIIPFGNDGVGIPGPFIDASPDQVSILVARDAGSDVLDAAEFYPCVVVPDLTVDRTSNTLVPALDARFAGSACWQRMPAASGVEIFDNHCAGAKRSGG